MFHTLIYKGTRKDYFHHEGGQRTFQMLQGILRAHMTLLLTMTRKKAIYLLLPSSVHIAILRKVKVESLVFFLS